MDKPAKNAGKTREDGMPVGVPFKKGNAGRPKGARDKLTRKYLKALHEDFKKHGPQAIIDMRESKPEAYIAAVGKLVTDKSEIDVGGELAITKITREIVDPTPRNDET